jgi:hypothetical protein
MPVKYSILSSHADASPKAGTKTSKYPNVKPVKSSKKIKSKTYEDEMSGRRYDWTGKGAHDSASIPERKRFEKKKPSTKKKGMY